MTSENISGYRLIDMEILINVFKELVYPSCNIENLLLEENTCAKKGLSAKLVLKCSCGYEKDFYTSGERTSSDRGVKGHDVNSRIVYTMRTIGHGYTGLEKFTTLMNMPKPMTTHTYNNIVDKMVIAATDVAKESMSDTVTELKGIHSIPSSASVQTIDVGVSVNGTWQRRGFSSNNGVVTAISIDTGKVVAVEIMSKTCKGCNSFHTNCWISVSTL